MKRILLMSCALFLLSWHASLFAQSKDGIPDNEYKVVFEKYLDVSGTLNTVHVLFPQMMSAFHRMAPNVPQSVLEEIGGRFQKRFLDKFVEMLEPVYKKYLTLDEIKGLVSFYSSPLGRKLCSVQTNMSMDAFKVGQETGAVVMKEVIAELTQRGYEVKPL